MGPASAERLRRLSEQHAQYSDLFIQFALAIGGLAHRFKEIGVTELRTHGHVRLGFLGHEIYIDYWPCIHGDQLVGKLRFTQRPSGSALDPQQFFALYFDDSRRVSRSPSMGDPGWEMLDADSAWEFLIVGLNALVTEDQLPAA